MKIENAPLQMVSQSFETTVCRHPVDLTPQRMAGFEPVPFETVQRQLPPVEEWEPERFEIFRPDRRPDPPRRVIPENLTLQNTLTDLLTHQASTSWPFPSGLPDSFFPPLFSVYRQITRMADDGRQQLLHLGQPRDCYTLFAFFDCLREGKVHPLFTESVETYRQYGKAETDFNRYQRFSETELPDLSDPLIKAVAGLPEGVQFQLSVYLPAEKARENRTLRQIAGLCEEAVLCGMRRNEKDFITGLIGKKG